MMVLFTGRVRVSKVSNLGSSLSNKSGSDQWWLV
jgi:hypothetical protein